MAEETRNAKLLLGVETKGTDKAEKEIAGISKTAKLLDRDLNTLGKNNPLAASFKEADAALGKLTDSIRTDLRGELSAAAQEANNIKPGSSGGGGSTPAAAKFRGAASLVGGGDIVGLIDDFQDLGEGITALSGDVTKSAGAAISAGLAFGAATVAIAVIGAALKSFTDQQAKAAAAIEGIVDAQRSVDEKINAGATTQQLNEERALLIKNLQDEEDRLAKLNDQYDRQFKGKGTDNEGIVDAAATLLSGAEEGLANSINKTGVNIGKLKTQIEALDGGLQDTDLAANDAKAAVDTVQKSEIQLADTRTGVVVDSTREAASAEKERAREAEKAIEQQARVQEKAAQEAEQNAEKAAAAQTKYSEAVANAGTQLKQAAEDINTKLGQNLADNTTALFRDATDIAEKYRRDTFDQDIKANQAERDALIDHQRDLSDILKEGQDSRNEALREGDFKQAFLAQQATEKSLAQERTETQREGEDRRRAGMDERNDLLRNSQRERADRLTAYDRQNADSRTAASRELQQAQLARTRSLEAASNAYRAELAQLGQYLAARNQMQARANQQALNNMSNPTPGNGMIGNQGGISGGGISGQGIPANMIRQIIG